MAKTNSIWKKINTSILLLLSIYLISCQGGKNTKVLQNSEAGLQSLHKKRAKAGRITTKTFEIDKNIRSIFQDKKGNYWFGTNSAGVYFYNGKTVIQYTIKDGLSDNQVQSIQEDNLGNIWFGTGGFGVCSYDGKKFNSFTTKENLQLSNGATNDWKTKSTDLWFFAGNGAYRYNGKSLIYLPLTQSKTTSKQSQISPFNLGPYGVYCTIKDKTSNIWFGTQAQGVCRFDGKSLAWFTGKGLSGSAVLGLFEDSKGNIWFGNNGAGLFKYDGKTMINLTEEKGLSNPLFKISGKSIPGTMARIYAINEDNSGILWIGTVDAGVWRYDGNNLINFTTKDGLPSNAINCIYKDKKGQMLFGTDSNGIFVFNGKIFTQLLFN
jgi:ligand-binding sensor domain-containing protein